jgi:hypothetical protein
MAEDAVICEPFSASRNSENYRESAQLNQRCVRKALLQTRFSAVGQKISGNLQGMRRRMQSDPLVPKKRQERYVREEGEKRQAPPALIGTDDVRLSGTNSLSEKVFRV